MIFVKLSHIAALGVEVAVVAEVVEAIRLEFTVRAPALGVLCVLDHWVELLLKTAKVGAPRRCHRRPSLKCFKSRLRINL